MATMTIRVPDAMHERLKELAERQGLSLNKLFEEWSNSVIARFDAEAWFAARAARGDLRRGLRLLDKLDKTFAKKDA